MNTIRERGRKSKRVRGEKSERVSEGVFEKSFSKLNCTLKFN